MGLSHPPGWVNISPDVKIGGYFCLKSEKYFFRYQYFNALFLFPLTLFQCFVTWTVFVIIMLLDCDNYNRDDFCNQQDVCENIIL